MNILLTGAHGQLGRELAARLQGRPDVRLMALARADLDIADREAVFALLRRGFQTAQPFRPDIIINAAAYTAVDAAESEPQRAFAVNALGAQNVAELAAECGAALLHLSTDYVFDGRKNTPYSESDAPNPLNVYGESKLAGERAVLAACPRSVVVRTSWLFGRHGGNFVKTVLRLAQAGRPLAMVADQFGAPTAAADLAAALLAVAERIAQGGGVPYGLYHFGGQPFACRYEFAAEIVAQAAKQGLLPRVPAIRRAAAADFPLPARRPPNACLDGRRFQTAFGIAPSDWRAALADLRPYLD